MTLAKTRLAGQAVNFMALGGAHMLARNLIVLRALIVLRGRRADGRS